MIIFEISLFVLGRSQASHRLVASPFINNKGLNSKSDSLEVRRLTT